MALLGVAGASKFAAQEATKAIAERGEQLTLQLAVKLGQEVRRPIAKEVGRGSHEETIGIMKSKVGFPPPTKQSGPQINA